MKKILASLFLCANVAINCQDIDPIDVVIPCHEKDLGCLEMAIEGARKNIKNVRRIIVVSEYPCTQNAEWFNESLFPFSKRSILEVVFNGDTQKIDKAEKIDARKVGWVYQQLLKLYAPFVIPDISNNVLIVDADTIFLNPVECIDKNGCALYTFSREFYPPYFSFMNRLIPGVKRIDRQYSGVCHHMLFQRPILEKIFKKISDLHGVEPWVACCKCIDWQEKYPLSEYELYFNFIFNSPQKIKLRLLHWKNISSEREIVFYQKKAHFVAWHNYGA